MQRRRKCMDLEEAARGVEARVPRLKMASEGEMTVVVTVVVAR